MNFSATASTTMNRLAAMQLWPLLTRRASAATLAATSRSASSRTMNGSLPPSSSTVFFRAFPARSATLLPASSLPVSVTAAMRGSSIRPAAAEDGRGRDERGREEPSRESRLAEHFLDLKRAPRHVGGVLEDAGVAGHERRRGEAEHLPEGEVPGHHREDHPQRVEPDIALLR